MKKKDMLLEGSIWKGLILFTLPILLGHIFQQLYNTADAWIVGHYRSDAEYAAVTSTSSLVTMLVGFFNGISVGAGVVIARYYGAKDRKNLRLAVHTTIAFGVIAGVLLTVLGVLCSGLLLRWMGTPADVIPHSTEYMHWYFAGSLAIVMYNLCMGILRAVGDSTHPLYYLIFSSLVNIALDFLFVGVLGWGVWAAALATTISQFVSVFLCLYRLMHVQDDYRVRLGELRPNGARLAEIIRYGLPSGIQNSITGFANVIVQSNINSFGTDTVAGAGTFARIEGFAFLPITCFTLALTTFVGQNLGAKQYDRAVRGTRFGIVCCMSVAELIGLLFYFFPEPLMRLFTDNPEAVRIGAQQTRIESLFFCMVAFSHCVAAIMRGAGRPIVPMLVMFASWCVLRVTYISVMVPIVQERWVIFSAYPLTWTVSSIVLLAFYLATDWVHAFEKKKRSPLTP